MTTVDDNIVSMKFDNAAFEQKLSQTIASLDKLRASLDMAGATRGLENVSAVSKTMDFTPMASGVDGISAKFLALSTIAITALANITTQILRTGAQMSSAFTISPILGGFQEYETNMNSIQTILSNTRADGTNLEQVNAALDQLNTYSDQTIYNFSQMARNIGTFTAAGVSLDTAVPAIKGIANLAAVSGSNAEQAATAMYQLSQALATGTVKLIDWNSVVNAGMGGEVFQKALFQTGQMMGTIENSNVGQTFEEWTAAGNTFRGSLQDGWLTAEVLTNTLQGFTGDLTEAQVMAMGYTQAQAAEIVAMGLDAQAAATKVKTFTQLLGTIKESIGSGWSATFRILIGNFEQARELFSSINDVIGGFIGRQADARNEMLQVWSDFGARDALIGGFKDALDAVASVLRPIGEAFREIFPPATAETLILLTRRFVLFAESLKVSTGTIDRIRNVFRGFFAAIEIGWTIVKEVFGLIADAVGALAPAGSSLLSFASNTGNTITALNEALVAGGGIRDFFEKISTFIQRPIPYLIAFKDAIVGLFQDPSEKTAALGDSFGRITDRLGMLGDVIESIGDAWQWLMDRMDGFRQVLSDLWNYISEWFSDLGSRIANSLSEGDFSGAVDIINIGLLGGIILGLRRFMDGFDNLDFGQGIVGRIREGLDGLTQTLEAMQANLRAQALMRLAVAIGILTVSVVALSMIDSEDLARALTAMAVGFGQLMAVMATIQATGINPARFVGMSAGLILLATAIGVLSIAVTNFSQLSWSELARGLAGVAAAMIVLTTATRLIAADTVGLVRAGVAMIGISIAIGLLSFAVKSFSDMDWGELGRGLAGMAAGLLAVTTAMNFMPTAGMIQAGAGLILISGAMIIMAQAVEMLGSMDLEVMAQGLAGVATVLLAMTLAANAMTTALPGAAAMVVMAGALYILTQVLEQLGQMSIGQLAAGIIAIAVAMGVIALSAALISPLTPALLGLATAMAILGGAFALFGVGAYLIAKAFAAIAEAGEAGITVLVGVINAVIRAIPDFIESLVVGLAEGATAILEAAPALLDAIKEVILKLMETVVELTPRIAEAIGEIITEGLKLMREKTPEILDTAVFLLTEFLTAVLNNIYRITSLGVAIIAAWVQSLVDNMPMIVTSAVNLITSFLTELGNHAEELVASGLQTLTQFLMGINDNMGMVMMAVTTLITTFLTEVANSTMRIVTAGYDILINFLLGISNNITRVSEAVTQIIVQFITTMGENYLLIMDAGFQLFTDFIAGIVSNLTEMATTVGTVITEFITVVGQKADDIAQAGADALITFLNGIAKDMKPVASAATSVIIEFVEALAKNSIRLVNAGFDALIDFMNGLADAIDENSEELRAAGWNIARAVLDGMTGGLSSGAPAVIRQIVGIPTSGLGAAMAVLGIGGPSKVFCEMGKAITQGLANGINDEGPLAIESAKGIAQRTIDGFNDILSKVPLAMSEMDEFNPVITPVLDLTKVQIASRNLAGLMDVSSFSPEVSFNQARNIATTTELESESTTPAPVEPKELTFIQNNYSPEALSTNDVYRNTKSQIALAKEELEIA